MMFCPSSLIILRKCPPRALSTLWQLSQSKDRGWALQQGNIYWKDSLKQLSQWKSWLPLALVDRFAWVEGNLWLYFVGLQQSHLSFVVPFKCKYLKLLWSYSLFSGKRAAGHLCSSPSVSQESEPWAWFAIRLSHADTKGTCRLLCPCWSCSYPRPRTAMCFHSTWRNCTIFVINWLVSLTWLNFFRPLSFA